MDGVNLIQEDEEAKNKSSVEKTFQKAHDWNNLKVFEGSEMSVNESILEIMSVYLRNRESKSGLDRIISSFHKFLPENNNLPKSSFVFFNYFKSLSPQNVKELTHYYCTACVSYLQKEIRCDICPPETAIGEFYTFDIVSILKFLFECRDLASLLESFKVNQDLNVLQDIQDGSVYRSLNINRGKYDINLVLNSDGVRVRKSEKELWLLLCTIVEVLFHLREAYMCTLGVWYDSVKPNMHTFLKPLCDTLRDEIAVEWTHPTTQDKVKSVIHLPLVVADAPARSMMQNLIRFNGRYGCSICEVKMVRTAPILGKRRIRVYPYVHNPLLRSHTTMIAQAARASPDSTVKGIKGPSILSQIPSVDISKCFIPEYMHAVLLGVVKQTLSQWTEEPGPWNISGKVIIIDSFLSKIQHPDFVHRTSRKLSSLASWKASDFYYFLLFESLPTLRDHLPTVYFQHFMLLVRGIYLLLKRKSPRADIDEADNLLKLYVSEFMQLYSDRKMTYNLHQLLHLALCVLRYGPLSCTSAFPFEGMNGMIAKATHGTHQVGKEIVNNIRICQGIEMVKKISNNLDGFNAGKYNKKTYVCLGSSLNIDVLPEEKAMFDDGALQIFTRAKLGYEVFTSELHKKFTKSANFYAMWQSRSGQTEYGSIKYFAMNNNSLCVFVRKFKIDNLKVFYHVVTMKAIDHFVPVEEQISECEVIKDVDILQTFVKVAKVAGFMVKRPNLYHQVM